MTNPTRTLEGGVEAILRAYNNHIIDGQYGEQLSYTQARNAILKLFREIVPDVEDNASREQFEIGYEGG